MKKKYFKLFFVVISVLFPIIASAQFSGGDGTEEKPYLIESPEDWIELSENVQSGLTHADTYFRMQNDIDFIDRSLDFVPVGGWADMYTTDDNKSFAGYFDGGGYSVLNLENSVHEDFVGLFGKVTAGRIQNLKVEKGTFTGNTYVGALVGYNGGAEVFNCHSGSTVVGSTSSAQVGGLIGYNEGIVSGCSSKATVSCSYRSTIAGSAQVGGLIGYNTIQGEITGCSSEATLDAWVSGNRLGGLIGKNEAPVSVSFSKATVRSTVTTQATFYAGGFIGENSGLVSDCYSEANVKITAPTPTAAGLIASNKSDVQNCYVSENTEVSSSGTGGKLGGLISDNEGIVKDCYSGARIRISGVSSAATVGGLVANNLSTIQNSYVSSAATISSEGNAAKIGGLVGYSWAGSLISDCFSEATIQGMSTGNYTCIIGGLVSQNAGEIKTSYCKGIVEGIGTSVTVGGLVGQNQGQAIINNCYATATLKGSGNGVRMGGLVGHALSSVSQVLNSYAAPEFQTDNSTSGYIGVLIGLNTLDFTNCYYLIIPGRTALGGTASPSTEISGKTSEELKALTMVASPGSKSASLNYNQSLSPLPWKIDFTTDINKGYPVLSWKVQPPAVVTDTAIVVDASTAILKGTVIEYASPILSKGFIYKRTDTDWIKEEINNAELEKEFTGLLPDVTYQYRAFAVTAKEVVYGELKTFFIQVRPIVETTSVTEITQTTATINGIVKPGLESITQQGFEFKIDIEADWTVFNVAGNNPTKAFQSLLPYTMYQYRVFATTSLGTVYGTTQSFRTLAIPPTVITDDASSVTQTSVTLSSTITPGSESITEQGFYYRTTDAFDWIKSTDAELAGLTAYTLYNYKAFVMTASDTVYGEVKTFQTLAIPPIVITGNASSVTRTSAILSSTITSGSELITEQGFYYCVVDASEWIKSTDAELTDLITYTLYNYKAFAMTANDTVYGEVKTFQTLAIPPTIITGDASAVTQTSVTLSSTITSGSELITEQGFYYCITDAFDWIKSIDAELTNLTSYTLYNYKAFVMTASDTIYGEVKTFKTLATPPTVITGDTSDVTQTGATLFGTVLLGSEELTAKGFEYNEDSETTWQTVYVTENDFEVRLTNLRPDIFYQYRAFVTTQDEAKIYGDIKQFKTLAHITGLTNTPINDTGISLYPNPATTKVNVHIENIDVKTMTIEIIDMQGHLIDRLRVEERSCSIDVSRYAKGVYLIHIFGNNLSFNKIEKLIIN